mmetsp:Transcript_13242/g.31202  ORF Transcript_13242/g.31202 Transcript_13242/m.31202 type:complete len:196 (-) Transcript_13242:18-605(-)
MEYEEELDDNGVLRVRRVPSPRVPSPFVPIQDEKEAPPMAFDADQMKAFRKTFDRYDETLFNHLSGSIPIAEMGTVLRSLGQNPTVTELAALCEEVDKDKSGTIEFDEFIDLMARTNKTQDDMDKEIMEAFRSFDVDGSGYLDREELIEALTTMGDGPVDEETVNEWIAEADTDGDGKINLKEFASMMINDDLGV